MLPLVQETMLSLSRSLALSIVAKATATTAVGLLGVLMARRSRAAIRHVLLAATFGVLLIMPVAAVVAPQVRIAVEPAPADAPMANRSGAMGVPAVRQAGGIGDAGVVPHSAGVPWSALLVTGWITGMALCLAPVAMGLWQVRALRRSAVRWLQGQAVADDTARDAAIHRGVAVLVHDSLPGPMTCGVMHPAIVLPRDAEAWQADDLERALVHELEHVRRFDWVTHCLARAVCAVYWFHPLVWIAWRYLTLEAERACDDAVLGRAEPTAYADQLVGLAKRLSLAAKSPAAKPPLLAMANRADLAARVGAVLDHRRRRGRAGALPIALASAVAAVLVITISPVTMVAAPQAATPSGPLAHFSSSSKLVTTPVVVTDPNGNVIEGLTANDFLVSEDGAAQTISVFEFQRVEANTQGKSPVSSYYVVGYYPSNPASDGKFRTFEIIRRGDTTSRLEYRHGYYASRPPSAVAPDGPVNGTPPVVLSRKDPEYSDEARKAKYQGTVVLAVDVDASGQVGRTRVVRSLGLGLDEKAIEAVKQWTFKPGMADGKPVAMPVLVDVSFRLL